MLEKEQNKMNLNLTNNKKEIKIDQELVDAVLDKTKSIVYTQKRSHYILPEFVGRTIGVYNGKTYITIKVLEEMVGMKLGQFSPTRKVRMKPIATKKVAAASTSRGKKKK